MDLFRQVHQSQFEQQISPNLALVQERWEAATQMTARRRIIVGFLNDWVLLLYNENSTIPQRIFIEPARTYCSNPNHYEYGRYPTIENTGHTYVKARSF